MYPDLPNPIASRGIFPENPLTARFARAIQPVSAEAITTDSNGLISGDVKIPTGDGEIPAYRAAPAKDGPFPMVLVVQEIFGVHAYIQDVCRRLAKLGYLALAPELYARQGDVSKLENFADILKIVSRVPDAQVMSDLDAAVVWAARNANADTARLGITGFCWGGRIVWLYAAHNSKLKAGVAWYGRLVGQSSSLQPKYPIDLVAVLKAPILGLYGGKDTSIPLDSVTRMRDALQA
ncbi:MAG: dienelactone hydrolase family protein, partial [Candidatus Binataceae bacterium]